MSSSQQSVFNDVPLMRYLSQHDVPFRTLQQINRASARATEWPELPSNCIELIVSVLARYDSLDEMDKALLGVALLMYRGKKYKDAVALTENLIYEDAKMLKRLEAERKSMNYILQYAAFRILVGDKNALYFVFSSEKYPPGCARAALNIIERGKKVQTEIKQESAARHRAEKEAQSSSSWSAWAWRALFGTQTPK